MAHDLDAVRVGGHGLLELVDHRLLIPLGVLLDQLDVVGRRGGPGAVGARQRRAVPLRAAALHVDDELLSCRCSRWWDSGRRHDDSLWHDDGLWGDDGLWYHDGLLHDLRRRSRGRSRSGTANEHQAHGEQQDRVNK